MGSVVGAFSASGFKASKIESITYDTKYKNLFDFILPKKGLVDGKKIEDFFNNIIGNKQFSELKKPFAAIATNLTTGKRRIFDSGSVSKALRASISYPVVFSPIKIGKYVYVDGGLVDPIPIDAVEKMECSKIIGSDVSAAGMEMKHPKDLPKPKPKKGGFVSEIKDTFIEMEIDSFNNYMDKKKMKLSFLLKWLLKPKRIKKFLGHKKFNPPDILKIMMDSVYVMSREVRRLSLESSKADVMIKPKLKNIGLFDFDKIEYLIKQGEKATEKALPKIKKLLN
jgi:NTE family protein